MKNLLTLSLAFLLAGIASAAEGYTVKTASGSTSAAVFFPGGAQPLRIVDYDVTSDAAAGTLKFHAGTFNVNVLKTYASTVTNLLTGKSTLASNDVVLFQNSAETVTINQVWTNVVSTNKTLTFAGPLATNVVAGDTLKVVSPTAFTLITPALSNATSLFVNGIGALAANDTVILERGPALPLLKSTVSSATNATNMYAPLRVSVRRPVTIGDVAYKLLTNKVATVAAIVGTNAISVESTNGIAVNARVVVETGPQLFTIYAVTNFSDATTMQVSPPLSEVLSLSNYVWVTHPTSNTCTLPAAVGDTSLILNSNVTSYGLSNANAIVVASTGYNAWHGHLSANASNTNIYTVVVSSGIGSALAASQAIYKLTNTYTAILSASANDYTAVFDVSTNLASGTSVILLPTAGGVFRNTLLDSGVNYPVSSLTFTGQVGLVLAPGDAVWYLGTTNSTVVGAATLRRNGDALFSADRGRPVRAVVTGTSACSINSMTGFYLP